MLQPYPHLFVSYPAQAPVLFLLLLILLTDASCALPAKITPPPNSQNLSVNLTPWAQGRLFAISDSGPFARHLQQDPDYVDGLGIFADFFSVVEERINHGRRNGNSIEHGRPCNVRPDQWIRASHFVAMNRGWPVSGLDEYNCITDYHGVPKVFPLRLEQLVDRLDQGFAAVNKYAYRIMLDAVGNWTSTGEDEVLPLEFPSQTCTVRNYGGFRLRGKWCAAVGITNQPNNFHVPDGKREAIGEVHCIENGTIVPALMTLPINPGTGEEHNVTDRATTIQTIWGGAVTYFSRFEPSTAHENVGLKAALAKGANVAQQMEDVIFASNTAILALPLVLNLVPASLITDCEKWKMVTYVLLSDVLTTLPMFIKGIELWNSGNARFTETVTRMGDTFDEETIGVEMLVATCKVRQNVRTIGIIFITVAILAMLGGMMLEVIASSLMFRAKKRRQLEVEEMQALAQFERTEWKYYNRIEPSRNWMMYGHASTFEH